MGEKSVSYRELDYFNALGCLLVVLIHVLSPGIDGLDRSSWKFAVVFFPWQLASYVVPAFLFCGAVKMSMSFARGRVDWFKYVLRRFTKIYVPYLIFTVVYYFVYIRISYVPAFSAKALFLYILRGNLASPFYYVIIVMQFYLLMPLWRWTVRRVPWYTGIWLSAFITLLMYKAGGVLAALGGGFDYFDRVFPTYLVYWVVGLYVGANYAAVRDTLKRRSASVLCLFALCLIFALLSYLQYSRAIYLYDLGYLRPLSDLAAVAAVLCLSIKLEDSGPRPVKSLLGRIHAASFSVYLSHVLFLTLTANYLAGAGVTDMAVLLPTRALVCYTLPFLLYWLLGRTGALLRRLTRRRS